MTEHTHDDDRLTFACPACIDTVQKDQHRAEIAEQPDRPLTVAWTADMSGTVTVEVKYLNGEHPEDVAERNHHLIHDAVIELLDGADIEIQEAVFGKKAPKVRR